MAYQIDYAYTCHTGKVRANNEDNFWCCGQNMYADNQGMEMVYTESVSQRDFPVLAVFDGMGGESSGEMAAYLASEEFGRYYEDYKYQIKKRPEEFLEEACVRMNHAICSYSEKNRIHSMGTTMAMLVFGKKFMYAGNLGDSRIYQLANGEFSQLSTDHVISRNTFGKAPLTQYLGIEEENMLLEPSVEEISYQAGGRYLICSDGLTDMLADGEIKEILSGADTLDKTVDTLLNRALERGGRDNITIILCEISGSEDRNPFLTWLTQHKNEIWQHKNER